MPEAVQVAVVVGIMACFAGIGTWCAIRAHHIDRADDEWTERDAYAVHQWAKTLEPDE